ncbi:hypothetical protein [Pseudoalteromonas piscicida]|uniref:hypothetical protein n=1 Tax=Pseudoalteromonas piscicida TaxID=43662 RepID=UPI0005F9D086|nr:hypothetical protein [Pseudoalteromonas piscicida]KJZ03248.1 hypothetical protein TW73_08830 [Pseudoalteromonas piscicida]
MKVTARNIIEWANDRQAQSELPIIVRRLIANTAKLTEIAFPGGDSVSRPGWDGNVTAFEGNAWVPEQKSCWELGCNKQVKSKLDKDYDKRLSETDSKDRQSITFIFVTPRLWQAKSKWVAEKKKLNEWRDVRVYDADDLELWFENAPSVALEFAEKIGISGRGVQSASKYWDSWSTQSKLSITLDAVLEDREEATQKFLKLISEQQPVINLEADSREEASAFACAALIKNNSEDEAICITDVNGWKFVEVNPNIKVIISCCTEGNSPTNFSNVVTVNPISHGDMRGTAGGNNHIIIPRLKPNEFENALLGMGEEQTDARRLCSNTGRSWSVYRRFNAKNPLLSRPKWFDSQDSSCLAIVSMVGMWSESHDGDKACLEAIYGKPYSELERSLRVISRYDDSPIIQIGKVWKAKSPLELTYLYCPQISSQQYKTFFDVVEAILTKPDPSFELPQEKRWMANVYGKVREESGLVLTSIVDSLIKLKVYAETSQDAVSSQIINGIDGLIYNLFDSADGERWLSLSSYLPSFAEASPDIFLQVLEQSLGLSDQPVKTLITETKGSDIGSACWYSGLLWALETVAWNASKLARVTYILAELDNTLTESGWSNSPFGSLSSFYRIHWPQSLATPEQKYSILRQLYKRNNELGWRLIYSLVPNGTGGFYSSNSRPSWRDDDAGSDSEKGVYYPSYLSDIGRLCLDLAKSNANRIAQLVELMSSFEEGYLEELLGLVESANQFGDDDKEVIRSAIRNYLNWHNSDDGEESSILKRLANIYQGIVPVDLYVRHAWLFANTGVNLPEGERINWRENEELVKLYRQDAIKEIQASSDLDGLFEFCSFVEDQYAVSRFISENQMENNLDGLLSMIWKLFQSKGCPFEEPCIEGLVGILVHNKFDELCEFIGLSFETSDISHIHKAAFLSCLPPNERVLNFIETFSGDVQNCYWQKVSHKYRLANEQKIFVEKFIQYNRFRSAFDVLKYDLKEYEPSMVHELLNKILMVDEPNCHFPKAYYIQKAISYLADSGSVSTEKLAQLEFLYFPLLRHHYHRSIPPNLKSEILSNPETLIELVCLVYRPESQTEKSNVADSDKLAVETAWQILHQGRGTPGVKESGEVDAIKFSNWVIEARRLGKEKDRVTMTDQTIGQWLSKCPEEPDGTWPCTAVCELLEQFDAIEIRDAFSLGVRNNRGVTSRSPYTGGDQERSLADKYRGHAALINEVYPQTAAMLEKLAKYYDGDANSEDERARLRIEGY